MRKLLERILNGKRRETRPVDFEWKRFQEQAREQFKKLQEKGLSIPVVTL